LLSDERALPDSGGSRQPLDRQLPYYREQPLLASTLWGVLEVWQSQSAVTVLPNAETPLFSEWRFAVLRWSLAPPAYMWPMVLHLAYLQTSPTGSSLLRAASLAVALAGYLLLSGLAGLLSSSRYITGTLLIAIEEPFKTYCVFSGLRISRRTDCLHYGMLADR